MSEDRVPGPDTRQAVRYWARRVRASLRDAEKALDAGQHDQANELSVQASGEAGEFDQAVLGYTEMQQIIHEMDEVNKVQGSSFYG